jgi:hypothetical protein
MSGWWGPTERNTYAPGHARRWCSSLAAQVCRPSGRGRDQGGQGPVMDNWGLGQWEDASLFFTAARCRLGRRKGTGDQVHAGAKLRPEGALIRG